MRKTSSRNGTAALRLPKNVSQPVSANAGYDANGIGTFANQPANSTKLSVRSLPVWGKLNDAGTIIVGYAAFSKQCGLYADPLAIAAHAAEIAAVKLKATKTGVTFSLNRSISDALIHKLAVSSREAKGL